MEFRAKSGFHCFLSAWPGERSAISAAAIIATSSRTSDTTSRADAHVTLSIVTWLAPPSRPRTLATDIFRTSCGLSPRSLVAATISVAAPPRSAERSTRP
eukprot:6188799-Pleurochrysis_carterae.AAC.1